MNIKKWIIGLDFVRVLVMFGMLFVNFMVIIGVEGNGFLFLIILMLFFEGRVFVLFVIFVGIGIFLMIRFFVVRNEKIKIFNSWKIIWKWVLFLFILGLFLYVMEWIGDILYYYGVYFFVVVLFIIVWKKVLFFLFIIILFLV